MLEALFSRLEVSLTLAVYLFSALDLLAYCAYHSTDHSNVGLKSNSGGYPIISYFTSDAMSSNGGFNLGGINGTGQVLLCYLHTSASHI